MTPDRWARVKEVFHSALDREPAARQALVAAACQGDADLRREVEALLEQHEQASGFLEQPARPAAQVHVPVEGVLQPGRRLGPYEVSALIGAGGMGEVYRARDTRLDREVAIKVLPVAMGEDPDALVRFTRETKAVAALSHPNILAIHDVGVDDGVSYAVMELLEGQSLRSHLAASPLTWRLAVDVGAAVADGLAAAHGKGIVHRDLKPENIFLTSDGQVKILDFGLARAQEFAEHDDTAEEPTRELLTRPGMVLGTVGYMSPEQLRADTADGRSDIFALGCVLYEMVSGRRPFIGRTPAEAIAAVLKEEPLPLSGTRTGVPPQLQEVIGHCLEKKPADRFQSARDLSFALRSTLTGTTTVGAQRSWRPARLGPKWLIPAMLAAVVVAAMILAHLRAPAFSLTSQVAGLWRRAHVVGAPVMLVVLPFDNLTGDKEQEYLSDGLTEELITQLGRLHPQGLHVIARTSAMAYKGTRKTVADIAREMNVDYVLEGSVRRSGDTIRVSAQLIRVPDETHLWAESYERHLRDVLTVQTDVAQAVADEIRLHLTPEQQAQLANTRPVKPEVHEAYLKGRFFWNQRTGRGLEEAIGYFQQALRADPTFASAYVGLADSYLMLGTHAGARPLDSYPKAKAAALKALELDETLAEAHTSLAYEKDLYEWDWAGAEREYRRAIELNPSYATAHEWLALHWTYTGRMDEAIAEMRRARELDPLSLIINVNLATLLHWGGREQEALDQFRKTLEMDPNFAFGRMVFGRYLMDRGMYKESIAELQTAVALAPTSSRRSALACGYARSGNRAEAVKILSELRATSEREYVPPWAIANIYVALGDQERGMEWLEKAYQERSTSEIFLKANPGFDPLRSDPRFKALLRHMNLPE